MDKSSKQNLPCTHNKSDRYIELFGACSRSDVLFLFRLNCLLDGLVQYFIMLLLCRFMAGFGVGGLIVFFDTVAFTYYGAIIAVTLALMC